MGEVMERLMGGLRGLTACRTKCPACGHVGMAAWTREEDVCRCRSCGARFRFRANTYRPLTEGMTDEERGRFYRRNRVRVAEMGPREAERQREMSRERNRRYYRRRVVRAEYASYAREAGPSAGPCPRCGRPRHGKDRYCSFGCWWESEGRDRYGSVEVEHARGETWWL